MSLEMPGTDRHSPYTLPSAIFSVAAPAVSQMHPQTSGGVCCSRPSAVPSTTPQHLTLFHVLVFADATLAVVKQNGDSEGHPRRRPCYVAPRVDGPRLRRHAQGLPLAPRRRLLQPAPHRRHFAPHRFRVPRKHEQHPGGGRPVGRRRLAVCRLLGDSASQWDRGHPRLGPTSHKGVLPRYDSNTRGQLPSRSPR